MEAVAFILGIGVLAFIMISIATSLAQKHVYLQLLLIFFSVYLMMFIPKFAFDEKDYCDIKVANITTAGNLSAYSYDRFCFENTKKTAQMSYRFVSWIIRLILSYTFIYIIYYFLLEKGLLPAMKKNKK